MHPFTLIAEMLILFAKGSGIKVAATEILLTSLRLSEKHYTIMISYSHKHRPIATEIPRTSLKPSTVVSTPTAELRT
jgi:hypothetical protein